MNKEWNIVENKDLSTICSHMFGKNWEKYSFCGKIWDLMASPQAISMKIYVQAPLLSENIQLKILDNLCLFAQLEPKRNKLVIHILIKRPYQILSLCKKDEITKIGFKIKGRHHT